MCDKWSFYRSSRIFSHSSHFAFSEEKIWYDTNRVNKVVKRGGIQDETPDVEKDCQYRLCIGGCHRTGCFGILSVYFLPAGRTGRTGRVCKNEEAVDRSGGKVCDMVVEKFLGIK